MDERLREILKHYKQHGFIPQDWQKDVMDVIQSYLAIGEVKEKEAEIIADECVSALNVDHIERKLLKTILREKLTKALHDYRLAMLKKLEGLEDVIQNNIEKAITEDRTICNEDELFELLWKIKIVEHIATAIRKELGVEG